MISQEHFKHDLVSGGGGSIYIGYVSISLTVQIILEMLSHFLLFQRIFLKFYILSDQTNVSNFTFLSKIKNSFKNTKFAQKYQNIKRGEFLGAKAPLGLAHVKE